MDKIPPEIVSHVNKFFGNECLDETGITLISYVTEITKKVAEFKGDVNAAYLYKTLYTTSILTKYGISNETLGILEDISHGYSISVLEESIMDLISCKNNFFKKGVLPVKLAESLTNLEIMVNSPPKHRLKDNIIYTSHNILMVNLLKNSVSEKFDQKISFLLEEAKTKYNIPLYSLATNEDREEYFNFLCNNETEAKFSEIVELWEDIINKNYGNIVLARNQNNFGEIVGACIFFWTMGDDLINRCTGKKTSIYLHHIVIKKELRGMGILEGLCEHIIQDSWIFQCYWKVRNCDVQIANTTEKIRSLLKKTQSIFIHNRDENGDIIYVLK